MLKIIEKHPSISAFIFCVSLIILFISMVECSRDKSIYNLEYEYKDNYLHIKMVYDQKMFRCSTGYYKIENVSSIDLYTYVKNETLFETLKQDEIMIPKGKYIEKDVYIMTFGK